MNPSPHPTLDRLCRAAGAASATLRRLDPPESPLRRLEPPIDQLQLVTQAARIENLANSTSGEAALGRHFATPAPQPPHPNPHPGSDPNPLRPRPRPTSPSSAPDRPPPEPSSSPRPRFAPPTIPAQHLARIRDTLEAHPDTRSATPVSPGHERAAIGPSPNPSRVGPPLPRPVAVPPVGPSQPALSPTQARKILETRSLASPLTRSAWNSPLGSFTGSDFVPETSQFLPPSPDQPSPELPAPSDYRLLELETDAPSPPADRTSVAPRNSPPPQAALPRTAVDAISDDPLQNVLRRLAAPPERSRSHPPSAPSDTESPHLPPSTSGHLPRITEIPSPTPRRLPGPADPPLRGLRALAALGQRLDREPAPGLDSDPAGPDRGGPRRSSNAPPAMASVEPPETEVADLADTLADVLRREALRHGIDPNAP